MQGLYAQTSPAPAGNTHAKEQLYKANQAQGGAILDQLKGLLVTSTVDGMTIISRIDLVQKKIRIEIWNASALTSVKQIVGEEGWLWDRHGAGRIPMAAESVKEMKNSLYAGVLGLRRQVIDRMQDVQIAQQTNDHLTIRGKVEGSDYQFVLNEKGQLVGDGSGIKDRMLTSTYSDLRSVNGILLPFSEVATAFGQSLHITYTRYLVNPAFTDRDWQEL